MPTPMRSEDIKNVIHRFHGRLVSYRDSLDELNVYPVPDGDTGTNMTLTMGSVMEAVDGASTMTEIAEGIARGSLMGARGNSGVILSQILRGLCEVIRDGDAVGTEELTRALGRASETAYQAVQRPVEGTILTVLRECAEAAEQAEEGTDLEVLLRMVFARAVTALEGTPELLPVLREAGVVDAGGAGLLLLIAAFLEVATGSHVELPDRVLRARADLASLEASGLVDLEVSNLRYEVMYMLDAADDRIPALRESWRHLGDSIVVVGGDGAWNCHIHTDEVGPAIEAGIAAGTPRNIRITDLREQAGDHALHAPPFTPRPEVVSASVGVVTVVVGRGLLEVFRDLGAQQVVRGGQGMNPSTEDLLEAVESIAADRVVILPNNKNIVPVAEQVDSLTTKIVTVVPTRSVAQGVAAMIGYNPAETDLLEAAEDMAAAASAVVTGEVTRAVRDATVSFGSIRRGDWVGTADGTIVVADPDQETVLRGLVAAILPPASEVLTLYEGEGARTSTTKALEAWLGELHPGLTIATIDGGQPGYPYYVSIE